MNYKTMSIFAIIATGILSVFAMGLVQQASAAASDQSNPVAGAANSNKGYQTGCKQSSPAQECATSPEGNGPYTSGKAHEFNGPQ